MKAKTNLPSILEIKKALSVLTKKETVVFWLFVLLAIFGLTAVGVIINNKYLIEVPAFGGNLAEGIIGAPRFINPILATSEADRDLTALVYSGLVRPQVDGTYLPDLADSYTISEDGLIYSFKLKDGLTWHDGQKVTTKDIEFTINKARDPLIKSPKKSSWEGVIVEVVSETEINFILKQPFASFLENTTMGILPKHIWDNVDSEVFSYSTFNISPVGTGPYRIKKIQKKSSGVPEYYDLSSFKNFSLGRPFIKNIRLQFYSNEKNLLNDLMAGKIDSINEVPPEMAEAIEKKVGRIITIPLPRVFAVFFNQDESEVLKDSSVREALEMVLDKNLIVKDALNNFGKAIDGPLSPGSLGYIQKADNNQMTEKERMESAKTILNDSGWRQNEDTGIFEKQFGKETRPLAFTMTTSNISQLKTTTEIIRNAWTELGADVVLELFEAGDLNTNVIRPRKYQALFFGIIVGRESDLFSFWHSSQRNDPGLNISKYTNIKADKLLEKTRDETKRDERKTTLKEIEQEITKDRPAIFIYSPYMIYALPKYVKGVEMIPVTISSERFTNINNWYIQTDKIWNLFI